MVSTQQQQQPKISPSFVSSIQNTNLVKIFTGESLFDRNNPENTHKNMQNAWKITHLLSIYKFHEKIHVTIPFKAKQKKNLENVITYFVNTAKNTHWNRHPNRDQLKIQNVLKIILLCFILKTVLCCRRKLIFLTEKHEKKNETNDCCSPLRAHKHAPVEPMEGNPNNIQIEICIEKSAAISLNILFFRIFLLKEFQFPR